MCIRDRIYRVCGALIPGAYLFVHIRRQDTHPAVVDVQIPWRSDSNVGVQVERLILGQNPYGVDTGIGTIAEYKINNFVLAAKGDCRFCDIFGERAQAAALSPCQDECHHFFFYHEPSPTYLFLWYGYLCEQKDVYKRQDW